jgi:transposase
MIDVRELLRRWQSGQSARKIAKSGIVDRKTAGRYVRAAIAHGVTLSTELTDEVVSLIARAVQQRSESEPSEERLRLQSQRTQIEAWLSGAEPLRLVRIHELLGRRGVEVSYTTLWRFAHDEFGWNDPQHSVRVDDPPPGQEAQVDFGKMGCITDSEGRRRSLWVLIVTLSMSRYMFVWPTLLQTLTALCEGLDAAWRFFDGVPYSIIPDNMTTAIVRAHPTDFVLNKSFNEYAQTRGFFVDPARVLHPKDKPRVENQVSYVRERWFAGETLPRDLKDIRALAETWCKEVAGSRIHGTTRRIPAEVYLQEERPSMLKAPSAPFDVPCWSRAKVHTDHHLKVARALYSMPTRFIGQTLDARIDKATVRLYAGTELLKVHARVEPGKRSTHPEDYPAGKADYAFRNVDGLKQRAAEHGPHVSIYAERLLSGPLPWGRMRQAYALLALCQKYGDLRVNSICASAIAFDVIDVNRVAHMLKTAQNAELVACEEDNVRRLPVGRFARDGASFATIPSLETSEKNETEMQ